MNLYLEAATNVPDLTIDFIEVKLKSGKTVSLNWDISYPTHFTGFLNAVYEKLNFDEDCATGKLSELEGMQVLDIGLYSEKCKKVDVEVLRMTFSDGNEMLTFANPFSIKGGDASG